MRYSTDSCHSLDIRATKCLFEFSVKMQSLHLDVDSINGLVSAALNENCDGVLDFMFFVLSNDPFGKAL